jgi:hypothetical protein
MTKLLMLSVIAATLAIPSLAARRNRPAPAFARMVLGFAVFSAAYALVVMFGTAVPSAGE